MKLSTKNAYSSFARNNASAYSILIACDFDFFKSQYPLGNINFKINHKAYVKAMANGDSKTVTHYLIANI